MVSVIPVVHASIAEAIKVNNTLTELDLSENNISYSGATSIAEAIKVNNTLTKLDLSTNNIGDIGAKFIIKALKFNIRLTHLKLFDNCIHRKVIMDFVTQEEYYEMTRVLKW